MPDIQRPQLCTSTYYQGNTKHTCGLLKNHVTNHLCCEEPSSCDMEWPQEETSISRRALGQFCRQLQELMEDIIVAKWRADELHLYDVQQSLATVQNTVEKVWREVERELNWS